jgi:tRNA1(Val) A37 N6-methylase TrmN6
MRKIDYIPNTNLKLMQDSHLFKMTSDSIHLCEFIKVRKHDKVLDIGCNNGVITMYANLKTDNLCIGIDINSDAISLAKENSVLNNLNHIEFYVCPLQEFNGDNFDLICCNPPYHKDSNHPDTANFDRTLKLDELAKYSYPLLKDKGRCSVVIKAERISEAITIFNSYRFGLKRIRFIHHSIKHKASSVCLEFIKNGVEQTLIEAPTINLKESL